MAGGLPANYEGAVIVISHDRYFLNRLVTQIAAMEPQGLHLQGEHDAYIAAGMSAPSSSRK